MHNDFGQTSFTGVIREDDGHDMIENENSRILLFEIASVLKSTVGSKFPELDHLKVERVLSIEQ